MLVIASMAISCSSGLCREMMVMMIMRMVGGNVAYHRRCCNIHINVDESVGVCLFFWEMDDEAVLTCGIHRVV